MPASLLTSVGLALCACAAVLLLPHVYLIAVHVWRGRRELAREHASNAAIASRAGEQQMERPLVCVQLPVRNELALVGAAIDSLCALEWPHDRLEVMVLDGSTDETSARITETVAKWRSAGVAVSHVRGDHSKTFKAGALHDGFHRTRAPFIAIFDVDFHPAPDFLRHLMPILLAAPRAAFVQARLDARNRDQSSLTRAQALESDTYRAYEQAACNWAGVPMTFNGTCGVWRREAIAEAGGWSSRTLVEDHDLSYRAFAAGWTCCNSIATSVAGELPESRAALAAQRRRWSAGTAQVFRHMSWGWVWGLKPAQAIVFVLLRLFYVVFPIALLFIGAIAGVSWWAGLPGASAVALSLLLVLALYVALRGTGAALAQRLLGRQLTPWFARDLISLSLMELMLLVGMGRALVSGLGGQIMPFVRTPKIGR